MDAKQIARQLVSVGHYGEYTQGVTVADIEVFRGDEIEAEQQYNTLVLAVEEKLKALLV